jgi:hypothetical protein
MEPTAGWFRYLGRIDIQHSADGRKRENNLESRKAGTDGSRFYLLWNPFLLSRFPDSSPPFNPKYECRFSLAKPIGAPSPIDSAKAFSLNTAHAEHDHRGRPQGAGFRRRRHEGNVIEGDI